jgi:hypothetical protein
MDFNRSFSGIAGIRVNSREINLFENYAIISVAQIFPHIRLKQGIAPFSMLFAYGRWVRGIREYRWLGIPDEAMSLSTDDAHVGTSCMTQIPRTLSDAKSSETPRFSVWALILSQPAWLKICAGIGLFLLILVPVLYFALRGKPTVLVLYSDVDIRDVNLGFRVPGRMREMPKAGSIRFTEPQLEQPLFIRISMTGRK